MAVIVESQLQELRRRVHALEAMLLYPNAVSKNMEQQMAEQAAKYQAMGYESAQPENLYAPLRSNVGPLIKLTELARRILNPDDLGHAVTEEVRNLAREALGLR